MSDKAVEVTAQIRWLIRRDMHDVLRIEAESFEFPWCEDDFMNALRQRNCIGMVVDVGIDVVGFMIYELHANRIDVLKIAVDPQWRRKGIGTAMLDRLKDKLFHQRRNEVQMIVRESNLPALLWLQRNEFLAVELLPEHYEQTADDGIRMSFLVRDN